MASGGQSGSWPRADLLDTVNISSTTEHLPDLPWAVRHHCSRVLHLMPDGVSAHNAWKQRGRWFQTVPAEMGLKWAKKKKKRPGMTTTLQFGGSVKNNFFFLGQRVCVCVRVYQSINLHLWELRPHHLAGWGNKLDLPHPHYVAANRLMLNYCSCLFHSATAPFYFWTDPLIAAIQLRLSWFQSNILQIHKRW